MKSGYCIGVDLGGTNIAVGLVDLESREIVKQHSVKTNAPRPCEEICRDIAEVCKKLTSMQRITMQDVLWVGVATPGIVKDGTVIAAFNLGWENAPFARLISEATGRPAYIANDANAAAYAEAIWGSGAGADTLVAFTLGTGVGGGIVIGGKIFEGMNGFAAEMGHMVLDPEGITCACGKRGCIEAYCSATALIRETKRMMSLYPESVMWEMVGGDVDNVSGKTPFRAWEKGDRAAEIVVNSFIDYLAVGISNVINILQPDVVCVGGGISREGEVLLAPLRERVLHSSFGTEGSRTKVVAATFRNDAGIIGAALLGLQDN
jgi:glucokinase